MRNAYLLLAALPLLSGCVGTVAKTPSMSSTAPVKVASAGVDAVTTSQKEADEKRGREMRKEDEERGKQVRLAQERCRKGRPLPTEIAARSSGNSRRCAERLTAVHALLPRHRI